MVLARAGAVIFGASCRSARRPPTFLWGQRIVPIVGTFPARSFCSAGKAAECPVSSKGAPPADNAGVCPVSSESADTAPADIPAECPYSAAAAEKRALADGSGPPLVADAAGQFRDAVIGDSVKVVEDLLRWGPTHQFKTGTSATVLRLDSDGDADLQVDGSPNVEWWAHSSDAKQWQIEGAADGNGETFVSGNRVTLLRDAVAYVARVKEGASGKVVDVESNGAVRVLFDDLSELSESIVIKRKGLGVLQLAGP